MLGNGPDSQILYTRSPQTLPFLGLACRNLASGPSVSRFIIISTSLVGFDVRKFAQT